MQHTNRRIFTLFLPLAAAAMAASVAACSPLKFQLVGPERAAGHASDDSTQFIGEGRLSHAPEFIEFTVTIRSECYASALLASQATDKAAARVMNYLRATIDSSNPKDGVFSEGGFSQPFSRYINSNLTTCRNTFQKTSTITMKTSNIEEFSSRYDEIQSQIFSSLQKPDVSAQKGETTFATLEVPKSRLYYETREELEQQALANALSNARKKFEATSKIACGVGNYKITRFVESRPDNGRPIAYARATPAGEQDLEFQAIWINKTLSVRFEAKSGTCRAG